MRRASFIYACLVSVWNYWPNSSRNTWSEENLGVKIYINTFNTVLCSVQSRHCMSRMYTHAGQVEEICQWETMEGRCHWRSEVIVMTSARWGRMKTGRCLDIHPNALAALGHDPLFLGCSEDVLSILDEKCSGRASCDVRIPDPVLDEIKPCYPDLTRYLAASYICVKGMR